MLTGIHFILTYTCNFECDHCFLHCSPRSSGVFTLDQVEKVLDEAEKIGTVTSIFFEGGEAFLFFPLLVESIRIAAARGFRTGLVTNAYGAVSNQDAELWLRPLAEAGLSSLSVSDDAFHYGDKQRTPAARAVDAAARLGLKASSITIDSPEVGPSSPNGEKGRAVVSGGAMFRGRAAEKLTAGLPLRPWADLRECPYEDLVSPSRVHVDPHGWVHLCQGISLGNMWKTPLADIIDGYKAEEHPIGGPLVQGGPAELARALGKTPAADYVDECHFCYSIRKAAINDFPDCLAPRQVYGL